jgi:hypothetical protein
MRDLWIILDDLVDNEMTWSRPGPDDATARATMAKTDELLAELVAAYLETEDEAPDSCGDEDDRVAGKAVRS